MQVIKLASVQGGIVSELTAAAEPTAALPSEALQCTGVHPALPYSSMPILAASACYLVSVLSFWIVAIVALR